MKEKEGRDMLVRFKGGHACSCSCTEGPIVHGSAPYEAVVGIEVALAKTHSYPAGNHGCKAILELGSHAQHPLGAAVTHSRTRARFACKLQCSTHLLQRGLGVVALRVLAEQGVLGYEGGSMRVTGRKLRVACSAGKL